MRHLVLLGLAVAGCQGSSSIEAREAQFITADEPAKAEGLETFTTSKTTKEMFKRDGLVLLQVKLRAQLPRLKKALDAGVADSGTVTGTAPPEELELTGTLNDATQRALGAWQHAEGIPETGLPDYETLERLGIKPDVVFRHRPPAETKAQ